MATDLTKGGYVGKDTYTYYNSATYANPTWVEMKRVRNVQITNGPSLNETNFHGGATVKNLPGYKGFSGSFEYVRKFGSDSVYDYLLQQRDAGNIVDLVHLNGAINDTSAIGVRAPVLLGEFSETDNGNDVSVVTIQFSAADAYDATGAEVEPVAFAGS